MNVSNDLLNANRQTNERMKTNLNDISLKNVRKRRAWGNALYFIFNPLETLKSICFGVTGPSIDDIRRESFEMLRNMKVHEMKATESNCAKKDSETAGSSHRLCALSVDETKN